MANFGHVKRMTVETEKGEITFRSKLEYKWYRWCQIRKEQGIIQNWWYEDPETLLELETSYFKNRKLYLPDFTILTDDGFEYEETKGYFPPKDYTKIKLAAQQYENPITLIFASLISNSKNSKTRAQYNRARRLEPYVKRVIYDAQKTIFNKIGSEL